MKLDIKVPGQNTPIKIAFQLFATLCSLGAKASQRKLPMASYAAAAAALRATSFVTRIQPIRIKC
ncbi:MAG: hypothetical protein ACT4PQ_14360 [Betaproteobacteria bacterium]